MLYVEKFLVNALKAWAWRPEGCQYNNLLLSFCFISFSVISEDKNCFREWMNRQLYKPNVKNALLGLYVIGFEACSL
jgi:hypothetical protein